MSCRLTSGYPTQCQDGMPGIKTIYIANYADFTGYTLDANSVVTGLTLSGSAKFYTFNLNKEAGEFIENINTNATNGTTAYEQVVNLYLSKYQTSLRNQITLLAKSKTIIIFADRNGQFWLGGSENGFNATGGSGVVGKAFLGDANGWNISLAAQESQPAYEVNSSLIASITA